MGRFFYKYIIITHFILATGPLFAAPLTSVSNHVATPTVGATTSHTVHFKIQTTTNIQYVDVVFPVDFDISGVAIGSVAGLTNSGVVSFFGNIVTYAIPSVDVVEVSSGTACSLQFTGITNSSISNSFNVIVRVRTSNAVTDGPTDSLPFYLSPGALADILFRSAADGGGSELFSLSLTAAQTNSIYFAGYDSYGNLIGNQSSYFFSTNTSRLKIETAAPASFASIYGWESGQALLVITNGLVSNALPVTVNPGTLAFIRIAGSETSDPAGWFGSANVDADGLLSLYLYGYDAATNSLGLQSGSWALSNSFGVINGSDTDASSIIIDPQVMTNGAAASANSNMVHAAVGAMSAVVSNIGISPGALASVSIESNTGGGAGIGSATLASGMSLDLFAAGYDADGNFTGNVSTNWGISGDIGTLAAVTESTNRFTATVSGTGSVVLTNAGGEVLETLSLTVSNSGVISHLQVRSQSGGTGDVLTAVTLVATDTTNFHVAGYDSSWNFVTNVEVRVLPGAGDVVRVEGANPAVNPVIRGWKAGSSVVVLSNEGTGLVANLTVTVNPGTLTFIRIAGSETSDPAGWFGSANVDADGLLSLYLYGYDAATNSLGLQSGSWALSNSFGVINGSDTDASSIIIDPQVMTNGAAASANSNMVHAAVGAMSAVVSNIGISPGALASVSIESNTGGGAGIGSATLASGMSLDLFAAGYDADGNFTGNVSTNWGISGDIGTLAAVTESTNRFTATVSGTGSVVLTNAGGEVLETLSLTVSNSGVVASIQLRTALDNGGVAVDAVTLEAGAVTNLYAASYDASGNFIANISVYSGSTNSTVLRLATNILENDPGLMGWTAGTGALYVTNGAVVANIQVTVVPGPFQYVRIATNASGDPAAIVNFLQRTTDENAALFALGFDAAGNYIETVPGDWTLVNNPGRFLGSSTGARGVIIDPTNAVTNGRIEVQYDGTNDALDVFRVDPGAAANVVIVTNATTRTPAAAQEFEPADTETVYAVAYDADGNYLGLTNVSWVLSGRIGDLSLTNGDTTEFTAWIVGSGTLTASNAIGTYSVPYTVTSPGVSVLSLTTSLPVPGRIVHNQEAVVYVTVTNNSGGTYSYTGNQTTLVFRTNTVLDAVVAVGDVRPDALNATTIPANSSVQLLYRFTLTPAYGYSAAIVSLKLGGELDGNGLNQDSYNLPDNVSQTLTVSRPASWQLKFSAPEYVLPGSSFNVTLTVSNTGEARISNVSPRNFVLSSGTAFTVNRTPVAPVTIAPGASAVLTWNYTVNAGTSGLSVQFNGEIEGMDEVLQSAMPEIAYNAIVTVIDTLSAALVVDSVPNPAPTTVEGARKLLFTLNLSNTAHSSIPDFNISNINFSVMDKDGQSISANSVLGGLELRTNGQVIASAASIGTEGTVGVTIPSLSLASGAATSVDVYGLIAQPVTETGFQLSISGASNFLVYIEGASPVPVEVVDTAGQEIVEISSTWIVIKKAGFSESLSSYPNPFSPSQGAVKIDFYLDSDSRVSVKLYTVTGSHVKTLAGKQLYPEGLNTLLWSGLNGNGKKVRNGVYLCVIKNENTGQQAVLKIAVVR